MRGDVCGGSGRGLRGYSELGGGKGKGIKGMELGQCLLINFPFISLSKQVQGGKGYRLRMTSFSFISLSY